MADVSIEAGEPVPEKRAYGPLFYIGAFALLLAMGIETVAVIGRHIGVPLLGAIEIIQMAILLTATSSMVAATSSHAHATVTFLTDRLTAGQRRILQVISSLLSATFFVALAAGGLWLAIDYWNAHEESEVLRIPFRPLRIIAFAAAASIAALFLWNVVRPRRNKESA